MIDLPHQIAAASTPIAQINHVSHLPQVAFVDLQSIDPAGESMMQTFVLLTRLSPETLKSPMAMEDFEKRAVEHIRQECPEVTWLHNYVLMGPYDYLDIFTAPDFTSALKVSALIRTFGRAHSEIWAATGWDAFKDIIHSLPAH